MDSSPIKKEMTNNGGVLSACKEAFVWLELDCSQTLWCLGSKKKSRGTLTSDFHSYCFVIS